MKSKDSKICHKCGREIPKDAGKCKFCGAVWKNRFVRNLKEIIVISIGSISIAFVLCQIHQTNESIKQADRSIELIHRQVMQNENELAKTDTLILILRNEADLLQKYITAVRGAEFEADRQKEKQFIEENKPIIYVKVTKGVISEDTLKIYIDYTNDGKATADLTLWSYVLIDYKHLGLNTSTVVILPKHPGTIMTRFVGAVDAKIKDRDFMVITKYKWDWSSFDISCEDTVGFYLEYNTQTKEWDSKGMTKGALISELKKAKLKI